MTEKLQKVLANGGLGSRREIEEWIKQGRVFVNGKCAQLGDRVTGKERITVDNVPVTITVQKQACRVIIYHKPEGEVCTRHDPEGRKTVFQRLPPLKGERWVMVGRLDVNTTGLLIFTNQGELANKLMHPRAQIEREYAVRVQGEVSPEQLKQLQTGVVLEDGKARFKRVVYSGGEGSNQWYHVVLCEGRNREVRRLWESQGVRVSRLIRIRFGNLSLPRYLRRGQWKELSHREVSQLQSNI